MFALLIGMLIALVFDVVAIVLAIVGLASKKRSWVAFPALAFGLAAIPANFFCWMVVLEGHSTRGEPITMRDDWELYAIVAAQTVIVLVAIVGTVRAMRRRQS